MGSAHLGWTAVGAVKTARLLGPGHRIVTVLCDGGGRHMSKFHNPEYLADLGIALNKDMRIKLDEGGGARALDFVGGPDDDNSTRYGVKNRAMK